MLVSLRVLNDVLPELHIDGEQICQAVAELLLNAVQARPKSAVTLGVSVDHDRHKLVIIVTDDGMGMDERTLAHAADPFFSAKRAGRRVGMGLTRVRQFATGHDGSIELTATLDSGTTAILTLGLDPADMLADTGFGQPQTGTGSHQGTGTGIDAGERFVASNPKQS